MSQYLDELIQAIPGVVYQFRVGADGSWRLCYLSAGFRDLFELPPEAALADIDILLDCILEDDRHAHRLSVEKATKELTPWVHEDRIRTPSGKIKWVRGQAQPNAQADGSVLWNGILVDISETKVTEAHLSRLRKMYAAIVDADRLIARTQNQTELFCGICKIAVELGGMRMAWIGIPRAADQRIMPVASYGDGTGYLDKIVVSARPEIPEGHGPSGTAFRENRPVLNQDFLRNESARPWLEHAKNYGWRASATFPIQNCGTPFAVLNVYSSETHVFDEELVALLERLAADISQAATALAGLAERKRLEEALRFRQFGLDHADEEIFWVSKTARILDANETACRILGYTREELLQLTVADLDPYFPMEKWVELWDDLKQKKTHRFESLHRHRDGSMHPTEVVVNYFEYEGVEYNCALARDITERKQVEETIRNLAYFDSLTELPNRRMLFDRLEQALIRAERSQCSVAVMFLDLDNFKMVNDTFGHVVGDELLKAVSVRLCACVRQGDTVSRHGGDEFIVLLSEIARSDDAALVAEKIIEAVNRPILLGDNTLNITTSIGIAVCPVNGRDDAAELMKKADKAMYAAKEAGRNGYRFFEEVSRDIHSRTSST